MRSGDSCERALLQDGKQYGERRASSRAALDGDPAVVFLANPVHHREPQPLRVPVLLGGEEGLEDAWADAAPSPVCCSLCTISRIRSAWVSMLSSFLRRAESAGSCSSRSCV